MAEVRIGFSPSGPTGEPTEPDRRPADECLIRACCKGDERAWKTLVDRYRRLVFSVPVGAYKMSESEAEEIFQSVVVKLYENIHRLREIRSLSAWLVVVTRNECRTFKRTARRWSPFDERHVPLSCDDPPDVVRALHAAECEHHLALAFERLDQDSRRLLSALYLEEPSPSYAEIAGRLGRPIGSLGPMRARGLKKLRRFYLELGGSEFDGIAAHAPRLPELATRPVSSLRLRAQAL